jgi:cysteine desulfurase
MRLAKAYNESMIYLDHNSTTPIDPAVADAMLEVYRAGYVNPASQHQLGQKARRLLEETREAILALLGGKTTGMDADRLIFTSGGTEANNLMLRGLAPEPPARVIVSRIEHPSMLGPAEHLHLQGYDIEYLPVNANGTVAVERSDHLLRRKEWPAIASLMLANNETGAIQPVGAIQKLCEDAEISLVTDAAQAVGKMPVSFRGLGVRAMSVAAHKFHGPIGIGALVLRHDAKLQPQLFGGFQQEGLRPGTECLPLAVGMRVALEHAIAAAMWEASKHSFIHKFSGRIFSGLGELAHLNSNTAPRLWNTLNIAFLGLDRQELLLALDMVGVCCSTGSACASGSSEPSPVLMAMGLPEEVVRSSLRFSFGRTNTLAEAEEAAERIIKVVNHLRSRKTGRFSP